MTIGKHNIAHGYRALSYYDTGCDNIAIGHCTAEFMNQGAGCNIAIGRLSSYYMCGSHNIAIGNQSLNGTLFSTGNCNVAIGGSALSSIFGGNLNIAIGCNAGSNITTGSNYTIIGSLPAAAGCVCTVLIGAGTCERIKVDNNGLYVNGALQGGASSGPAVLNDISGQFDGYKTVFALLQDQTSINTIVDSKDLEVVINGARLTPYVKQLTYPWLMDYDSFKGFRVSSGNLIIYNAPWIGDSSSLIWRNSTTTAQTRKYPYSATTIALGD